MQNNTFVMISFSLYIKEYFWSYDQKYYWLVLDQEWKYSVYLIFFISGLIVIDFVKFHFNSMRYREGLFHF